MLLPPNCICLSWTHVQFVSSCVERIKLKWTPNPRCTAEQPIQTKTPYVTLAHVGFLALQSKHVWDNKIKLFELFENRLNWGTSYEYNIYRCFRLHNAYTLTLFPATARNRWNTASISSFVGWESILTLFKILIHKINYKIQAQPSSNLVGWRYLSDNNLDIPLPSHQNIGRNYSTKRYSSIKPISHYTW